MVRAPKNTFPRLWKPANKLRGFHFSSEAGALGNRDVQSQVSKIEFFGALIHIIVKIRTGFQFARGFARGFFGCVIIMQHDF
jgi:hypothetical protein